jgi:hypothetical protein
MTREQAVEFGDHWAVFLCFAPIVGSSTSLASFRHGAGGVIPL